MSLMYNQNQPYIVPEFSNMTENKQVKHKAKFHVQVNFDTRMEKQTLTCDAKLPNEQYPTKQAGMTLMVSVGKYCNSPKVVKLINIALFMLK